MASPQHIAYLPQFGPLGSDTMLTKEEALAWLAAEFTRVCPKVAQSARTGRGLESIARRDAIEEVAKNIKSGKLGKGDQVNLPELVAEAQDRYRQTGSDEEHDLGVFTAMLASVPEEA